MKPLLSIIIATKNRVPYCISVIKSILSLDNDNIQLVIQDNSDNLELNDFIETEIDDNRLTYRYTPPPFSSIQNFNAALELVKGEYVCMIGDDDGINPEIILATEWAFQNNIDAITGNYLIANYRWENTGAPDTLFTKMGGDALTILDFNGDSIQPNIEHNLLRLMQNGCTNHLNFNLPKLYHGVVRMKYMKIIKQKTGEFIKGLSPDVYSALSLSCVINNLVVIDYPLTIPGACGVSSSINEGQKKTHSKKIENAPHFRDRGDYKWSKEVPGIYCAQTIWSDSGFAALRDMNRTDLIKRFNKYQLYANILYADKTNYSILLEHIKNERNNNRLFIFIDFAKLGYAFLIGPIYIIFRKKLFRRLSIILKLKRFEVFTKIYGMEDVMNTLSSYLKKNAIRLEDALSRIKL
jgi:glycosyltransferase involved in cell wall biosynthesis